MTNFLDRLKNERADLEQKIYDLQKFYKSETFAGLASYEYMLLYQQELAMKSYSGILARRIAFYGKG